MEHRPMIDDAPRRGLRDHLSEQECAAIMAQYGATGLLVDTSGPPTVYVYAPDRDGPFRWIGVGPLEAVRFKAK